MAPARGEAGMTLRVLIIGGYGTFGGRIVALLEDDPRLTLIIAGRDPGRASEFCNARVAAKATVQPAGFDRAGDLATRLDQLKPAVVIDASGPFQDYGSDPYRVVEACLALGISYLDLADGAGFVAGISQFDAEARAKGVFVLAGVSSFPVLTAAVVRHLSGGMMRVDSIRGGIAPSPDAGVGPNVIRAIAGYAGQRTVVRRGGTTATGFPLIEAMRCTIAPPGQVPLRNTLFSLVDVPDLQVLPQLWPQVREVWIGAGPRPEILHRALMACAWLVRWRLLASLLPLAPVMALATRHLRWGEDRGGMFVQVTGVAAGGARCARSWHMIADGDAGPLIPSMAVEALVRRLLAGGRIAPGARNGAGDLELADYEAMFEGRCIRTGIHDDGEAHRKPLYARLLGPALAALPNAIRELHAVTESSTAQGRAKVERGRSLAARLVAGVIGFPLAASDVPVSVRFEVKGGVETWTRTFGARTFVSRQWAGRGRSDRLLCESFGPLSFAMALVVADGRLALVLRNWSLLGLPLPRWLGPRSLAYETVAAGKFRFHVEISHPLAGLIVLYSGWLIPDRAEAGGVHRESTLTPDLM